MTIFKRLPHLQHNLDLLSGLIHKGQRFLVTMHCRPDGDAAGSAIAMGHILRALKKDVTLFNVDLIPDTFTFLPGAKDFVHELHDTQFDLCIVLDCAEPRLLGRAFPADRLQCPYAYIDHHAVPWQDCLVNLHDRQASAAGEIVFHLMNALGVELNQDIATALYTSIITDTGSFRYTSTTPDAMHVCGYLLNTGISVWDICSHIYENNPVEKLQLLALVLQTLWLSPDGKIACLHATHDMLRKCRCSGALTDGFINYARSIRGVEVSIFLTQLEDNLCRMSFRSRGHIDVSKIAARFDGGGHKNAAACNVSGAIPAIRENVANILHDILHS
ncbi:MAG: bifunctional oligoribonuclease/PAP phosphatase NrnA [Proteobacteria bacterium]|nr:bifunctional oligoribonuclease/PAP phosphatase NrnA [Pseudomonadota bacterium]